MTSSTLFWSLLAFGVLAYYQATRKARYEGNKLGGIRHLNSLPFYYGASAAIWTLIPASLIFALWVASADTLLAGQVIASIGSDVATNTASERNLVWNQIQNVASGALKADDVHPEVIKAAAFSQALNAKAQMLATVVVALIAFAGFLYAIRRVSPAFRARERVEKTFEYGLLLCSCIAILTTVGIVFSVLFESIRFFSAVPITEFLFGTEWSPQMAMREDQVGSSGAFGAVPLFTGTLLISFIALVIAVPVGLMSAIYLAEYSTPLVRAVGKPLLEILAGIPTVVYGFFAALTVAPLIRTLGESVGLSVASESALAAGLVMGVMIIPFVSSLSEDVITAVPQSLRQGALALGATRSEMIKQVVFPAALPGIVGGILLAASRAIGETMIVVMAAGLAAKLTANPLDTVTTVTVQIVTLLVGDQEFDSPKTLAAFALGLMLFIVTLILNIIALQVVKKYREQYE